MNPTDTDDLFHTGLATEAITLQPFWRIRFSGPRNDLDRIFNAIVAFTPLEYGKTDHNGYLTAGGTEYYRPMSDTPTGAETDTRKRPDIFEMAICIAPDESLLKRIIDTIYQLSSYYEPPMSVERILRSSTNGLDDSDNPHRWWNTSGDWKKD